MIAVDDLRGCGLDLIGDPPTTLVRVGATDIRVRVIVAEPAVDLRADLGLGRPSGSGSLDSAGLTARGDTAFLLRDGVLSGTRRLISPTLGTLYDAVFELAKATCAAARLLHDIDQLSGPAPAPVPAAAPTAEPTRPAPAPPRAPAPMPVAPAPPPPPRAAPPPAPPKPPPLPSGPMPGTARAPWRATHRVGGQGAAAYAQAGDAQPVARLDPWLDVQVVEDHASGWAHVVCSNTWSTWIDRRTLTPL